MNVRTENDFMIAGSPTGIAPMLPMMITTRQQAYRTAAWIEAMSYTLPQEEEESTMEEVRMAVRNT